MEVKITPKDACALYPTDILFQSVFWGQVKNRLGWKTLAFNLSSPQPMGDVLVLTRSDSNGRSIVHIPQGPEPPYDLTVAGRADCGSCGPRRGYFCPDEAKDSLQHTLGHA